MLYFVHFYIRFNLNIKKSDLKKDEKTLKSLNLYATNVSNKTALLFY